MVLSERLAAFKRLYRWLNLILIQQAIWPLALLLTSAPPGGPARLPWRWFALRLAASLLAALLALVYLLQRPPGTESIRIPPARWGRMAEAQARLILLGLPLMLAAARLVVGPAGSVMRLLLFGLVDAAAYQLIHFGVVARSYPRREQGDVAAVILFGLSWGLRQAFLTGAGGAAGSAPLALAGGTAVGLLAGAGSLVVYQRLGLWWAPAVLQWFLFTLVVGFGG